jgi:hypothetical protein
LAQLPDELPETTIPPCEGVVGENEMPFSVNVPLINDPDEGAEKLTGPPCSLGTEPVRAPGAAIMVTAFADESATSKKTAALRETNRLFTVIPSEPDILAANQSLALRWGVTASQNANNRSVLGEKLWRIRWAKRLTEATR